MLLKLGEEHKTKLPKLAVGTNSKKTTTPHTSRLVDDSLEVRAKMARLFAHYKWKTITTEKELVAYLRERTDLGLDCETTGFDVFKDKLVGISLGTEEDCVYIPLTHKVGKNYSDDIGRLEELLRSHNLWGYNLKFDLKWLKQSLGLNLKGCWCGYLASRLNNSAELSNELKDLYTKYIDPEEPYYSFGELFKQPFDEYDPEIVGGYAAVDALKHIRLGKKQEQMLNSNAKKLLLQLELPLAHILVEVELTGVALDMPWCNQLTEILEKELKEQEIIMARDYEGLNPGSPKQVAEWLYDKLGMKPMNADKGTGEDILENIDHPLADRVLAYRKVKKLLSTYAKKMPAVSYEGIVHCTYNQYGADTGRFSSKGPNLQNIPKDNRFRKMFRARDGKTLVSCDYTQQEIYIMAALADDEKMKEAYDKNMDFYAYMASLVFNEPYGNCTKKGIKSELRNQMKAIVLALNYDKGIKALTKDLNKDRIAAGKPPLTTEDVKNIYDKFFDTCPSVKTFRASKLEFAKKYGYVETVLGRRRYFNYLHKEDFECDNEEVLAVLKTLRNDYAIQRLIKDAAAEKIIIKDNRRKKVDETRQVVNSVIQGSAADMTKLAMLEASKDAKLKEMGCQLLLQVHDEIIAEFPDETAEEGGRYLANLMVEVGSELIGIRVVCEPSLMKSWEKD